MKLLADMLNKGAYDKKEAAGLRGWIDQHVGKRLDLSQPGGEEKFNQSLAMYLIVRDLMAELNAVGGGFMNQLEWGSDRRGIPLPIADVMESLFNSTLRPQRHEDRAAVRHRGRHAGPADDALHHLAFRRQSAAVHGLPQGLGAVGDPGPGQEAGRSLQRRASCGPSKGIVDGDNSGSASFDWAGRPGDSVEKIMSGISMPGAELYYFPGGGNSVTFITPGGIDCIAGRLAYSALSGMFSMVWDEATTVDLPEKLADAVSPHVELVTWPHTFIVPKYATMAEYKQYAPANHFHATWGLKPSRLQYWMDLANVLSVTPWSRRPQWLEGVDRPQPLLYLLNGGENHAKMLRARGR